MIQQPTRGSPVGSPGKRLHNNLPFSCCCSLFAFSRDNPNPKASSGQQHFRQRLSSGGGGSVAPSPASSSGGRAPPSVASSPAGSGGTFTGSGGRGRPLKDVIVMAACGEDEVLPTNADLPADVFTCCLTTPMPMALRWFIRQNKVCACVERRVV